MPDTRHSHDRQIVGASSASRRVSALARAADNRNAADQRLIESARRWLSARRTIFELFPKDLLKDASWAMLLELFLNWEEGGICYVKQLIITSGESSTAAMRLLDRLEAGALIERMPDPLDRRRVMVQLTEFGRNAMIDGLTLIFIENRKSVSSETPVAHKPHRQSK